MNTDYKRVSASFGPETRFEATPAPLAPFRAVWEDEFERLKCRLLNDRLRELPDPALNSQLRRAANEAAALAWVSSYPLLMLPELLAEKVAAALAHAERQADVWLRSRELLAV